MQSTTVTNYQSRIATIFNDFCKKAGAAVTGGNYLGAQAFVDGARELLVVLQGQPGPKRPGRPPREAAAAASNEMTEKMNDEQFVAWLGTQASPVPFEIALHKTGWSSSRLNLRGGVLDKAGRIIIEGKGKNKLFRPIAQPERQQQAAA